jgi:hypothetical protein
MKQDPKLLFKATRLTALSALSLTALAADPALKTEPTEAAAAKESRPARGDLHRAAKVSDLRGLTVKNNQNQTIG